MEGETQPHDQGMRDNAAGMFVPASMAFSARLPIPPTTFIGREREVAEVCALLGRPSVRLVTLMGPGGIGKTRLSLAVADALRGEYQDDWYCVSLSPLTDAGLVLPAIAQALGAHEPRRGGGGGGGASGGQEMLRERLLDLIGHRKVLLVLDNFEQVMGAAGEVAALVNGCARLKVLVTSREMLRLSAEHLYHVPPMTLPDLGHLPPLEFLAQVEAVRLFVTRVQVSQPNFALTPENGRVVAAICQRLDGLPLAIELAAARVRLLPPVAMLDRLDQRLALLTGGARDVPARHQTLRAAIVWSYDLLGEDEQRLFRRLAVFVGGCTLEAAEEIYGMENIEVVASLMDKSLVRQEQGEGAEGRLGMLETVREFALEQLEESGEGEAVRLAHARYYLGMAEEAEPKMVGAGLQRWLVRLEEEHDNLRAAMGWAVGGADVEIGARLAASLWWFWLRRGHLSEGRRWLARVLAVGGTLPAGLRARVLNGAGRLALRQGEYTSAQELLEESLALRRGGVDTKGEMQALNGLGLLAIFQNDLPRAQRYFEESLVGWRALGDKQGISGGLNNLGLSLRYQGEFERAAEAYEGSLALGRELDDKYMLSAALHNLGQMAHHQGDDARAHALLAESLIMARELNDRANISLYLADLGGVWASQGEPVRAAKLFGAAEALRESVEVIMYEGQRLAYEQDVARGAAQLEGEEWEAAWAEGRAMTLDEACALAVEALPSRDTAEGEASPVPVEARNLSERELEVLRLLAAGLTYAQIGERLMLSFHTVHAHLRSIYGKLGVASRGEAARFAVAHGLAPERVE